MFELIVLVVDNNSYIIKESVVSKFLILHMMRGDVVYLVLLYYIILTSKGC